MWVFSRCYVLKINLATTIINHVSAASTVTPSKYLHRPRSAAKWRLRWTPTASQQPEAEQKVPVRAGWFMYSGWTSSFKALWGQVGILPTHCHVVQLEQALHGNIAMKLIPRLKFGGIKPPRRGMISIERQGIRGSSILPVKGRDLHPKPDSRTYSCGMRTQFNACAKNSHMPHYFTDFNASSSSVALLCIRFGRENKASRNGVK